MKKTTAKKKSFNWEFVSDVCVCVYVVIQGPLQYLYEKKTTDFSSSWKWKFADKALNFALIKQQRRKKIQKKTYSDYIICWPTSTNFVMGVATYTAYAFTCYTVHKFTKI